MGFNSGFKGLKAVGFAYSIGTIGFLPLK